MKILVTGGTGYIGSHTVVELIKAGHEVTIIDNLFNSKIEVLDKIATLTGTKPEFHKIDILDLAGMRELFQSHDFEAVIHFAGLKAVAESIEKPLEYYETNVQGTVNLLKCMAEFKVNKIIFSSSATVYGAKNSGKLSEDLTTGVAITNPYG
ncbi:MAG: SDR family NAD(P)-dependent oxidoreductase, partial [Candidatus Nanosynbacter sp.]|nr:SDR family NAD(P)-dependent oxidoreductase [Candidatus Nanosynbacter sp.]